MNNRGFMKIRGNKSASGPIMKIGNPIGSMQIEIDVNLDPFVQQMAFGVQTESGWKPTSKVDFNKKSKKVPMSFELQKLNILTKELKEAEARVFGGEKISQALKRRFESQLLNKILSINSVLSESSGDGLVLYMYQKKEEMELAQSMFIEIGEHVLEYIVNVQASCREEYFRTLKLIFLRHELDINNMAFDKSYNTLLSKNPQKLVISGSKYLIFQEKVKEGCAYQKLLYRTLELVFKSYESISLAENEKDFCDFFLAVAYFRIPEFREHLLKIFREREWASFPELKLIDHYIEGKAPSAPDHKEYSSHFDWDESFFKFLLSSEKGKENKKKIIAIIEQKQWNQRFITDDSSFCSFVSNWGQYVEQTLVMKEQIPWIQLPGFILLLHGIIFVMKNKKPHQYSEELIMATTSLLKNNKLLNVFILVLFRNTP